MGISMNKKQEYALAFFGLAAVVVAFLAIVFSNYTLAEAGAGLAVIAMVISISFIFFEQEEIDEDRKEMAAQRKGSGK